MVMEAVRDIPESSARKHGGRERQVWNKDGGRTQCAWCAGGNAKHVAYDVKCSRYTT